MQRRSHPEVVFCTECGKEILWETLTKTDRQRYYSTRRAYCCEECKKAYVHRVSSETMTRTNRKYAKVASARMKANNPMSNPETREKMSKTLKRIGHRPVIRGGNGKGMTKPQAKLMNALTEMNPASEFVIKTKVKKINEEHLPTHYKIDIAIPEYMIAIEVDGGIHCQLTRKEQDKKKANFLESAGWTVLRFTNREVLNDVEKCKEIVMSTILK